MNYNIKGTHVDISDELRTYVERQLTHAEKLTNGDSTAHVDVELSHDELRHGDHYRAEFTLEVGGAVYRASAWGGALHEAIDVASNQLQHELRQQKSKRLHVFRHTAVRVKEYLRGWRSKI